MRKLPYLLLLIIAAAIVSDFGKSCGIRAENKINDFFTISHFTPTHQRLVEFRSGHFARLQTTYIEIRRVRKYILNAQ